MTTDQHATISEDDGIITVTMDRQEKLNAISPQMTETYWAALRQLAERDDLRCMVITARGRYFSAGIDLSAGGRHDVPDSPQRGGRYRYNYRKHHLLYDEFEAVEKPIIQAVQGICLGAGVEMAMSCDFRFCTPNAEFRLPEVNIGLLPGSGGASRLTRLIWQGYCRQQSGNDLATLRTGSEKIARRPGPVHVKLDDVVE